jgi:non-ribosomal peptide synthetase-like protein
MSFVISARRAAAPTARTLLDIFDATVQRCAGHVALDAADATLTYGQLDQTARALADRLRQTGVGPGDRVGVQVQSGTSELYAAILGVLRSGAAYVPVDFDDPPARAHDVLSRSGACAVVRHGLTVEPLRSPAGRSRDLTTADDAWVIFTSGSTGAPKGVAVSHRCAAAFVDAEARLWTIDRGDRVLAGLSVAFDASCEEIWLAWRHGAALVPAPRAVVRAGADLGPWLAEHRVTVVSTVPTLAAMWDESTLAGVRLLILGGEACPEPLAWRLAAGRELWNTYGPTEATVVSTAARIRVGEPVTIGRPLDGWQVAVVDEDGAAVGDGEPGELVVAGAGVARYLDPLLDTERFRPIPALGWERAYPTGDIVRETEDGLTFIGRRDDQVKIGGRRIELGEIEAGLCEVPGVTAAATVVRESAAGNRLLVGYVTGDVTQAEIRAELARRLPDALVPLIVVLDELPRATSGKVDRSALPWPAPVREPLAGPRDLSGTARWLAERWAEQLGPVEITPHSDFFVLGGSSLAAAKLTSVLRARFPAAAVADIYNHRRLADLSARLDLLGAGEQAESVGYTPAGRHWGLIQLAGVLTLLALAAPPWLIGILAVNHEQAGRLGPVVGWGWLIAAWLALASAPGRAMIVIAARWLLLRRLTPGRHPRHGGLTYRIWFVERLAEACNLDTLGGTPWAARYARLLGHDIAPGARLGTLPPPTGRVCVGAGATIEPDVDLHGWWIDGQELVVGALRIGPGARVGTRSLLMPGASIGAGAEIEPGALVTGAVPAGERWAGSPARPIGAAGDGWPAPRDTLRPPRRGTTAMYGAGVAVQTVLPLLAAAPGIALIAVLGPGRWTTGSLLETVTVLAPLIALSFVVTYALLVAAAVRAVSPLIVPGWHRDDARVGWALWFTEGVMASARGLLFGLFASVYTRRWLRLLGVRVGRRTEISTAVGLNRLTSFGELTFATDDVALACANARGGWLYVAPIAVGDRSFLGNSSILTAGTTIGDDSLVGALSTPPRVSADGTSWFGCPPLELPRIADRVDPSRTTDPPARLILARAAVELVRILFPATVSTVLGALVFWSLDTVGAATGVWAMLALTPLLLAAAGVCAALTTVTVKWALIGRYGPGEHPLWSSFVWRDEIVNTCQEQLAGGWLLRTAMATPLLNMYLRMMGVTVGREVWCETLNVTEFDTVTIGDGAVINRHAVVETHLFQDRLLRIGPARLGAGATLGPATAILPDTVIGAHCRISGRSVVMRGEQLPPATRWHGAPVVATR